MVIQGRIQNGVIVVEGGLTLPEGTQVTVLLPAFGSLQKSRPRKDVVLPLVDSDKPGSVTLTAERIAEILDEDDASA